MATLAELGLTLRDIDLGDIEAEADHKLSEYFIETDFARDAVSGTGATFLGRKGSGKSALFTQLPRLMHESGQDEVIVRLLTPDNYAWAALKGYREQGLLLEHAHTNAWRYTLATEIAVAIVADGRTWPAACRDAVDGLAQFVRSNYGDPNASFGRSAGSLIAGLRTLNLSAFGFGVAVERGQTADAPVTPAVTAAILERIQIVLQEGRVVVAIDRLDDSWDASSESQSLLVGLLKAGRELNNTLGARSQVGRGLRVVSFLRSDIYDQLRFDDKDKHRASERLIVWTPDLLSTMLSRRLPGGVRADDLFERGEMRGGITPVNYIVKRTFLRPREVLQFAGYAIQTAGMDSTLITKDQVRAAEDRYSTAKVADLKQEYQKAALDFEPLLESLRDGVHRYDSFHEFEEVFARKAPALLERLGFQRILEVLFEASVIGIRPGNAGSPRFKSEDANLVLPAAGAIYIHQGLGDGLRIREARARA